MRKENEKVYKNNSIAMCGISNDKYSVYPYKNTLVLQKAK
jgi:hypothetical protein